MNTVAQSVTRAFENPRFALAFRICVVMLLAGVLTLVSNPAFAFAQEGGGNNPFADAGARSTAVSVLTSMRFWVWIAAGLGFCSYLLAYFAQGIVPSFFQQYRDYLRNGALLMVAFGVVIQFIISQASGS
jgi:hypothetical protein